jgi:hypothetical protein
MALVYFISDGEYIKIGVTDALGSRLATLQNANARPLVVVHLIDCDTYTYATALEKALHLHFKDYRALGEWFKLDWGVVSAEIETIVDTIDGYLLKYNLKVRRSEAVELQRRFDRLVKEDLEENYEPLSRSSIFEKKNPFFTQEAKATFLGNIRRSA